MPDTTLGQDYELMRFDNLAASWGNEIDKRRSLAWVYRKFIELEYETVGDLVRAIEAGTFDGEPELLRLINNARVMTALTGQVKAKLPPPLVAAAKERIGLLNLKVLSETTLNKKALATLRRRSTNNKKGSKKSNPNRYKKPANQLQV